MSAKKLLAVALATLLVSAGVGAAATSTGTGTTTAATAASVDEYEADASYDNGTVTLTVTANGSGVEGLSVARDDALVGTTDADGAVTFDVNDAEGDEVELDVTGENVSGEVELAFENGSVTVVEAEFEADVEEAEKNGTDGNETDRRGPAISLPADASENAKAVVAAINAFLSGETNASTLGEAVSSVAGNASDGERGPPAGVGPDGDDTNETDDDRRGPPEDVGPNGDDDDTNETDDDRRGPPEDVGPNGDDDDGEEAEDDEEEADDEDGDEGARGNNGR